MAKKKDKKKERTNHMLSLTIARSISDIIKFSVDDEFRERSFKALGVISTKDVENEIYKKLVAFSENPNSRIPQTVNFDNETDNQPLQNRQSDNQPLQKSEQTHVSENVSQSQEKYEVYNEYKQNFSQTIYSQIYSEISQEQEQRRLREKDILSNTNSGIWNMDSPQIFEPIFQNLQFKY